MGLAGEKKAAHTLCEDHVNSAKMLVFWLKTASESPAFPRCTSHPVEPTHVQGSDKDTKSADKTKIFPLKSDKFAIKSDCRALQDEQCIILAPYHCHKMFTFF